MSQVGRIRLSTGGEMIPAGTFSEMATPASIEPSMAAVPQIEEPKTEITEPTTPVVGGVETMIRDEGFKDIIARLAASRERLAALDNELADMAGLPAHDAMIGIDPPEGTA
ncbi:MAG TPA: hypothetical protein VHT70_05030 [Candidatus Saccharimonadales bacterium]|jgi:hypothetical protein|nr:hypothetical protein [Candidatus Saccharimonadales bacterium]